MVLTNQCVLLSCVAASTAPAYNNRANWTRKRRDSRYRSRSNEATCPTDSLKAISARIYAASRSCRSAF
uniref:RxLR effector candidate protein n=1 Tax=Hyaloperonospora arabidopsidis (strain Emoy2) TaxID=559515 RepID=M4B792_HYAAE